MNSHEQILFWQNKYLIMENEVRKAMKGIARLKKREKYRDYEKILDRVQRSMLVSITEETIKRNIDL